MRKLLKSNVEELRRSLELEDILILNRVNSPEFKALMEKRLAAHQVGQAEASGDAAQK